MELHTGMQSGVVLDMEAAFQELYNVEMIDAPDVPGGGTTSAMGFNITDWRGNPVTEALVVKLGAFDDADLQTAAVNATINTATAGSILSGAGTNALVVKTSATGQFRATLTDAADEVVYLSTGRDAYGDRLIDHRARDTVEFSA